MKLKRIFAALLAFVMLLALTACGGDKTDAKNPGTSASPSASESASPSAGEEKETVNEEEVIAFCREQLAGYTQRLAGLDPDEVVMTVNGEDISAELFLYWLTYDCMYWDYMSRNMYGATLDFDAESSSGLTYREYLLEDATQMLINYVVLRQHAAEEGVLELTGRVGNSEGRLCRQKRRYGLRLSAGSERHAGGAFYQRSDRQLCL